MEHLETKAALTVTDAGEITGIAWVFSKPDRVGDTILKGAVKAKMPLPLLFGHNQNDPVGVWDSIEETADTLVVKGRLLIDELPRAREVWAMIKAGALRGLSIGFQTKASKPNGRGRIISDLTLFEISAVTVPCHEQAQITGTKSDATNSRTGGQTEGTAEAATAPQIHKETKMENQDLITDQNDETKAADAAKIAAKNFDAMQARLDALEAKAARPGFTAAPAEDLEAKAFGNFLRHGAERLAADEVKALTVASNANGGFLAPEQFGNELIKLLAEYSPIRQYAKVISISAPEIVFPRRVTGTAATWVSEIANRTESGMTFEQVKLVPHEMATFTDISTALLEDNAYNLEGELLADYAESFARTEGLAFVKGTGTGQPFGIMAATGIAEIKTGVAANFPATNPADVLIAVYHKIASTYAQNGVWMMNRNTLAIVRQWKDSNGRYLILDPIAQGAPATLLGRPVVEMPDMDDIGAGKTPILFGDMSGYRIVDRVGLSTLRDPFSLATNGQTRFHARKRVGADVTHPDRFVKLRVAV